MVPPTQIPYAFAADWCPNDHDYGDGRRYHVVDVSRISLHRGVHRRLPCDLQLGAHRGCDHAIVGDAWLIRC